MLEAHTENDDVKEVAIITCQPCVHGCMEESKALKSDAVRASMCMYALS